MTETILTVACWLFVIFFFGLCIFTHELGHFLAGRLCKLHIDAFSIGFRKILWKKIDGVEYRIGCIPLGGYVELPQIDATDAIPKSADGRVLPRATPCQRIVTAFAGPFFNILFGFALGCLIWYVGIPRDSPELSSFEVRSVEENSPEYKAGLRPGDRIVSFNGESFRCTWAKMLEKTMFAIGEIDLGVMRGDRKLSIRYTPVDNPNAPGRLGREKIGYPFYRVWIPLEMQPEEGGPAWKSGVRPGDLLLSVDGRDIEGFAHLKALLAFSGEPRSYRFRRGGETYVRTIVPEPVPDSLPTFKLGLPFSTESAVIDAPSAGSPAEAAGLKEGDEILTRNGEKVKDAAHFIALNSQSRGEVVTITARRRQDILTFVVKPVEIRDRTIGVGMQLTSHPSPWRQFTNIVEQTWNSMRGMAVSGAHSMGLTDKTSTIKARHMSGPVGILNVLYLSVKRASVTAGLYFVVVISFALAIFNLLPLPVLDGGHIAFALIELVFRRPVPAKVVRVLSTVFIGLLVLLMLYVTYFDVLRLLPARNPAPASGTAPAAQIQQEKHPEPTPSP